MFLPRTPGLLGLIVTTLNPGRASFAIGFGGSVIAHISSAVTRFKFNVCVSLPAITLPEIVPPSAFSTPL